MGFAYAYGPARPSPARSGSGRPHEYAFSIVLHRAQALSTDSAGQRHSRPVLPNVQCVKEDLKELFRASGGVIRRSDRPKFEQRLDRLHRQGALERPLPGIFALAGAAADFRSAVVAGALWAGPDAVLVGAAAAKLTFWPDLEVMDIEFAIPYRRRCQVGRWAKSYRRIPEELIWERDPVRLSTAALTAVDLAAGPKGGEVIDVVLRKGVATLGDLWEAFHAQPHRPDNPVRRILLEDSRDEPWSEAERELHRLLRNRGIRGWKTNRDVWIAGKKYIVDLLFEEIKVAAEVDGWEFHGNREAFESDRRRRNELEAAGYLILNFTWRQITEDPDWVAECIRTALELRNGKRILQARNRDQ